MNFILERQIPVSQFLERFNLLTMVADLAVHDRKVVVGIPHHCLDLVARVLSLGNNGLNFIEFGKHVLLMPGLVSVH